MQHGWPAPFAKPSVQWSGAPGIASESIPQDPPCAANLPEAGEDAAWKVWENFRDTALDLYNETRNNPDIAGTSKLSPYLRFGVIHSRSLLAELNETKAHAVFRSELGWREFYADVLFHQPRTVRENLQRKMDSIVVDTDERAHQRFALWCEGKTGYPIVDAGMRELNKTGFMHNRVRMLVGSFLCKHLLIDWRWGEAYFAEKLHDYEQSSNVGNWQWVAGCGVDAAPYFRIFNPTTQIQKFDKELNYIQKWVPEFQELTYDSPIVEHKFARERCLKTYKEALL